jgi:hypothetical protein
VRPRRQQLKAELVAIVSDLRSLGYSASDIARVTGKTPEWIRQILHDLHLTRPRLHSVLDLPHDLQQRCIAVTDLQNPTDNDTSIPKSP